MLNYDILVNKENPLDKDYIPNDLIITDKNENNFHGFNDPSQKPQISKSILPFFIVMQLTALREGHHIVIDSGYRSYEYQQIIYDKILKEHGEDYTKKYVALPGTSEHQTGLAFDVSTIKDGVYVEEFTEENPEYKWLKENSYKFGFILRYPKGKENETGYNFEPWHFRFVGLETAKYIYENDLTLETYHQKRKNTRQRV